MWSSGLRMTHQTLRGVCRVGTTQVPINQSQKRGQDLRFICTVWRLQVIYCRSCVSGLEWCIRDETGRRLAGKGQVTATQTKTRTQKHKSKLVTYPLQKTLPFIENPPTNYKDYGCWFDINAIPSSATRGVTTRWFDHKPITTEKGRRVWKSKQTSKVTCLELTVLKLSFATVHQQPINTRPTPDSE